MKRLTGLLRPMLAIGIAAILINCGGGGYGGGSNGGGGGGGGGQNSGFAYKGITHVSWSNVEYSTMEGTASQDALAATGANWAGVLATWYMPMFTSTTIAPASYTPSDNDVIAAIAELHAKGLKVMLKPHVDVQDGTWRGAIAPTDMNAWFRSFDNFILHYATIAAANNVEMLCFGTEYKSMSGSANLADWTSTISQIRGVYSGKLVYAANAAGVGDEYTSVSFWDLVDVIGLDAYVSLTDHADPSLSELTAAWSMNWRGENVLAAFKNFAASYPNQPVIFTEIGYRSAAGANINPWDYQTSAPVDDSEQQNCYEAMYEVWSRTTAIKGNFWWDWPVPQPVPATDTDYSTWMKPAESVLQNWK